MEQKPKKRKFKNILLDHDLITRENNIIRAERAFVANSAAQWGMGKIARDEFNKAQIDSFGKILKAYLKGRINLSWEDGMLRMETKMRDQSHEQRNGEDSERREN